MPCAFELWAMKDFGIKIDNTRVLYHQQRLKERENEIVAALQTPPVLSAILSRRVQEARAKFDGLVASRTSDVNNKTQARREARHCRDGDNVKGTNRKRKGTVGAGQEGLDTVPVSASESSPRVEPSRASSDTVSEPTSRKSPLTPLIAEARKQLKLAEAGFNPVSDKQKAWLLYEQLGLPAQYNKDKKTKAQHVTTDKKALPKLAALTNTIPEAKEIIALLLEFEATNHLRTSFIETHINKDGTVKPRMHADIGLHRTASGRMASGKDANEKATASGANIQNQPKPIRDIFVPDPDMVMIQGDWSKVEWLVTLFLAGDRDGLQAALDGEDQHTRLATVIYSVAYSNVTTIQRQAAKKITHAVNYGAGAKRIAMELAIPLKQATALRKAFITAFPLVAKYRAEVVKFVTKYHYVDTLFGFRRYFWQNDPSEIIAQPSQGTVGDMLKIRFPEVAAATRKLGGYPLTTTHDSVLIEAPIGREEEAGKTMKAILEAPFKTLGGLSFPADVKVSAA